MKNQAFELIHGLEIRVRELEKVYELSFLKSAIKTEAGWKIWSFEDS
jgi:hypothetical protein